MTLLPASFAFLPDIGGGEVIVVLFIVLLLFGGTKLPQLAKGLGQSVKEFKKASKDEEPAPPAKEEPKKTDTTGTHGAN